MPRASAHGRPSPHSWSSVVLWPRVILLALLSLAIYVALSRLHAASRLWHADLRPEVPSPLAARQLTGVQVLVLYVFSNTDPQYLANLEFFVNEGIREADGCEYIIIVNRGPSEEVCWTIHAHVYSQYSKHDWHTLNRSSIMRSHLGFWYCSHYCWMFAPGSALLLPCTEGMCHPFLCSTATRSSYSAEHLRRQSALAGAKPAAVAKQRPIHVSFEQLLRLGHVWMGNADAGHRAQPLRVFHLPQLFCSRAFPSRIPPSAFTSRCILWGTLADWRPH